MSEPVSRDAPRLPHYDGLDAQRVEDALHMIEQGVGVLVRAVDRWGGAAQLAQAQEECAELIAAISHYRRGREGSQGRLQEEVADALITVAQVALIAGGAGVASQVQLRMQRLAQRLLRADEVSRG